MSMVQPLFYTPEMVRRIPDDGRRYEVVRGELLVTPAPRLRHQFVVGRFHHRLAEYCERTGVGLALASPADISLSPDALVQPDLFVIPAPPVLDIPWSDVTRLLLAVEVVSPGTARADRHVKRRHFQEAGVPAYWVVDPDARMVEVWTPASAAPIAEREHLTWSPGDAVPLIVPLSRLFGQ